MKKTLLMLAEGDSFAATAGYGDTHPLVPNNSVENRAKNRRVELKRDNCTGG